MQPRPIRHRRARRTDFDAVAALLVAAGAAVLTDVRAGRSRFRRIVADLGSDLYVATIDDRLCGIVHISYARHLLAGAKATLELLVVAPLVRRRGVATSLTRLAATRARRRGCHTLSLRNVGVEPAPAFFAHLGWRIAGEQLLFELTAGAD